MVLTIFFFSSAAQPAASAQVKSQPAPAVSAAPPPVQKLSEQRASTTRGFLIEQGLPEGNINSKGFGKTLPVADNSTAEGRQKNRQVEIIVSG
jgi:outer membrane protein OmpA-like peptidoglycan-associated protein